jgi:hypothetical protein
MSLNLSDEEIHGLIAYAPDKFAAESYLRPGVAADQWQRSMPPGCEVAPLPCAATLIGDGGAQPLVRFPNPHR